MTNAKIQVHRRLVSQSVSQSGPVGEHEFFFEFSITIEEEGCFTVHVGLWDSDTVDFTDDWIGEANDALLPCFCFKPGTARKFFVTGGGPKPAGSIMPPGSDGVRLPGITGAWPKSDGPFMDTLDVYARISLHRCASGGCDSQKGCEPIDSRALGPAVATWTSFSADVAVPNGTGTEEGLNWLEKILGVGMSVGTSGISRAQAPEGAESGLSSRDAELMLAKLRKRLHRDRYGGGRGQSAPDG